MKETKELPVVTTFGIQKVSGRGYMPVKVKIQGTKVLETTLLEDKPGERLLAEETAMRGLFGYDQDEE